VQHQERVQRPEYPEHAELFRYWHYIRKYLVVHLFQTNPDSDAEHVHQYLRTVDDG
jgi:hypothetical protein